jgi:hypothetical protein
LTERYRCVHLEAGRRVPSGRPEEPPIVRICLVTGRWRSRFLISRSAGSAQGSLAGERSPRAQLTLSREAPFLLGEEASA